MRQSDTASAQASLQAHAVPDRLQKALEIALRSRADDPLTHMADVLDAAPRMGTVVKAAGDAAVGAAAEDEALAAEAGGAPAAAFFAGKPEWARVYGRQQAKRSGIHPPPLTRWHEPLSRADGSVVAGERGPGRRPSRAFP